MDRKTRSGRRRRAGLTVIGCVGVIETGFRRGLVPDLRESHKTLLAQGIRIDRHILNRSLTACGLPLL